MGQRVSGDKKRATVWLTEREESELDTIRAIGGVKHGRKVWPGNNDTLQKLAQQWQAGELQKHHFGNGGSEKEEFLDIAYECRTSFKGECIDA